MEKMEVTIIVAVAKNNVIGANNQLIWHLPADLKHFKTITMGHTLIMGRKTFESIGKPLSGRRTIVVSRNSNFAGNGFEVASSLEKAIELGKCSSKVFVVGGAQIYKRAIDLPVVTKLLVTEIGASFDGDTFFPKIDKRKWKLVERIDNKSDEKNPYDYNFLTYLRRKGRKNRFSNEFEGPKKT